MKSRTLTFVVASLALASLACNLQYNGPARSPNKPAGTAVPTPTIRPFVSAKGIASDNWAGYIAATSFDVPENNTVTDVKGTWIVPPVICGDLDTASSIWVGIDGGMNKTVEQAGTEQDCAGGNPTYLAWFEMYPKAARQSLTVTIHPGDQITAEIKYAGNNEFTMSLVNLTTGEHFDVAQTGARARRQTAEWIVEAPYSSRILPLTNFGVVTFISATATINGHTGAIADSAWQHSASVMFKSQGALKAQPSTLTADGKSFMVLWKAN